MALGYGPWCQDHPAVIKDQASPVSACHASGAAVADVLPRCEIGSRPAVPSPDGCRAVGLPHRHRMPAAALEKGLLPTGRRRPRRGAHLGWLRPGLGPAAQPCAHPDRRCPQIPCPPMIRSVRTLASEWCAGRQRARLSDAPAAARITESPGRQPDSTSCWVTICAISRHGPNAGVTVTCGCALAAT